MYISEYPFLQTTIYKYNKFYCICKLVYLCLYALLYLGKGRPIDLMMKDNRAVAIPETVIPTPENAFQQYERGGGKLKSFGEFGKDPLSETPHLQEVRQKEFEKYPTFDKVFNGIVNNDPSLLRQSIQAMITITKRLASQIV